MEIVFCLSSVRKLELNIMIHQNSLGCDICSSISCSFSYLPNAPRITSGTRSYGQVTRKTSFLCKRSTGTSTQSKLLQVSDSSDYFPRATSRPQAHDVYVGGASCLFYGIGLSVSITEVGRWVAPIAFRSLVVWAMGEKSRLGQVASPNLT
jgi:hypothetical protein